MTPSSAQPLPLEYLRLASFDASPESRKEKAHSSTSESVSYPTTYPSPSFLNSSNTATTSGSGRLFDYSFRSRYRNMYPFTLYHASAKSARRYTLYAESEEARGRWGRALRDAVAVRMARQDSNKVRGCFGVVEIGRAHV